MHYEGNVTDFQKLLLLRCFRVDRMYRAVTDYVTVTMGETWVPLSSPSHPQHSHRAGAGTSFVCFVICLKSRAGLVSEWFPWAARGELCPCCTRLCSHMAAALCKSGSYWASLCARYVQPPVISFDAILQQSTPFSPVVFILSPGCDPVSDLMKLAERTDFKADRLKFLAMGQGQEEVTWMGGWGCAVCSQWELQAMLLRLWDWSNFLSIGLLHFKRSYFMVLT